MNEKSNNTISRFLEAQNTFENSYSIVLSNIREQVRIDGRIDHIFPELNNAYHISDTDFYLENVAEAEAYLQNEVLRSRLIEISEAVLKLSKDGFKKVFGRKARHITRCASLFYEIDPKIIVFKQVLDKFFAGLDWDYIKSIHKTRVIDDWQKFIPNVVPEDDPTRVFLRECSESIDLSECFPTEEEKQTIVEEFNRGNDNAKELLANALLPAAIEVGVDSIGNGMLLLDTINFSLRAIVDTIEEFESSPIDILSVCVKKNAEKNIQDNMPHSNGRMSEKGSKEMALILLTETMSDDEKRKHQISKMSEETGIREEKVDALLKLLNI